MNSPATKETAAENAVIVAREVAGEADTAARQRALYGALAYYAANEFANLVVAHNARRVRT